MLGTRPMVLPIGLKSANMIKPIIKPIGSGYVIGKNSIIRIIKRPSLTDPGLTSIHIEKKQTLGAELTVSRIRSRNVPTKMHIMKPTEKRLTPGAENVMLPARTRLTPGAEMRDGKRNNRQRQ